MRKLYCRNCGYDLATLVSPGGGGIRCPECGSAYAGVAVSVPSRTPWIVGLVACLLGWITMVGVVLMWGNIMPSAVITATVLCFGPLVATSAAAIKTARGALMRDEPRWIEFAFIDALLVGLVAFALNFVLCLAAVTVLMARMQS